MRNAKRPTVGVSRVSYRVLELPPIDALSALESLVLAEQAEYYWIYESATETRVALDAIGEVVIEDDAVRSTWDGAIFAEQPAIDPFAQVGDRLDEMPLNQWRAYGYIAFDTAGYYYPFPFRSPGAQLRFVLPRTELIFTDESTIVRTIENEGELIACLQSTVKRSHASPNAPALDFADREVYQRQVNELLVAIRAKSLTKAILSRCVQLPKRRIDIFSTFCLVRQTTATGRSFAFCQPELSGVGASPELLMHTDGNGSISTNPLAGTRPRGQSALEDQTLRSELSTDAKENKEHTVSLALAEEELESVCKPNSVTVERFRRVVPFRTVQHLSSTVKGQLATECTLWDGLRALFPGVTVSGVDKISAIRKIAELEQRFRGPYAGAMGWVDSHGASDLAIGIRSAFEDASGVSMSAGAGVIAESSPEREYEETVHKMRTMQEQLVLRPSL